MSKFTLSNYLCNDCIECIVEYCCDDTLNILADIHENNDKILYEKIFKLNLHKRKWFIYEEDGWKNAYRLIYYDNNIEKIVLPKSLTYLILGYYFNQERCITQIFKLFNIW